MSNPTVYQVNISSGGVPKKPIDPGVVTTSGITGDAQAKPGIHGGPYRALCLFPMEEIHRLAEEGHPVLPGSLGENITTAGLDWKTVVPNARFRLGTELVVEITGYADPCKTIAPCFLDRDISRVNARFSRSSRVYARVITPGTVRPGDPILSQAAGDDEHPLLASSGIRMVSQVSFAVSDLERSISFYRDSLGAQHERTVVDWGLAFLRVGETKLMLEGPAHRAHVLPGSTTVTFAVEDIDASFEAMSARGVQFDAPPLLQWEENGIQGWMAFLRDPDGNRLALVCEVPV